MRLIKSEINKLQELANELISKGHPVHFSRAETQEQQSAIFAQRCSIILSRGWAEASEFPNDLERDEYDDDAVQIQGRFEQSLVASARLILPPINRPLPVEANHGIELKPAGEYAEIGRTIVCTKDTRLPRQRLFAALLGFALMQMTDASCFRAVASANRSVLRLYRRLGIAAEILGPSVDVGGEERFPVSFDVLSSAKQVPLSHGRDVRSERLVNRNNRPTAN